MSGDSRERERDGMCNGFYPPLQGGFSKKFESLPPVPTTLEQTLQRGKGLGEMRWIVPMHWIVVLLCAMFVRSLENHLPRRIVFGRGSSGGLVKILSQMASAFVISEDL